ncbi:transmembrane protein 14 homolog [Coccinella septempunctata]|uniref:transmembrane protein 14 homolog n=1 Tax=Coccinella septempunctata TaxID=41139 RepID=UPI001D085A5C|nr:transmembrane protein 14 homolog [Coccinella septempunctata]
MTVDIVGLVYAGVVAAGGIMGYVKAGSIPSLAAGLVFGGALTYGAHQMSMQPPNYVPQLVTSSVLAGVMGYRFYNSGKLMPAGVVCILSVGIIVKIALGAAGVLPGWLGGVSDKTSGNMTSSLPHTSTVPNLVSTTEK